MALDYYNFDKILSYNAIFSMCVGGRGIGKSWGMKKKMIGDALKKSHEFIWLRRYKEEITDTKSTFFSDISHEFPGYVFRVQGNEAQAALEPEVKENKNGEPVEQKPEWFTIGYFVVLSKAQAKKGVSYPKVRFICFDEFIIEKGLVRYLPDEVSLLMNFYNTVDRYRDKARLVMLANGVTMTNPYFLEWRIQPDQGKEFISLLDGDVVCHLVPGGTFADQVKRTRFGRMMTAHNGDYASYAIDNVILDANDSMIGKKTDKAVYRYTIETSLITYSVWRDPETNFFWIQEKLPKGGNIIYTTEKSKMSPEKRLMLRNHRLLQMLRSAYSGAHIQFDTPRTREAFLEIFKQ